ncbi:MAG: acyl-CoA synthetase [Deltaproteobacteria bacterium HGW-Deltaproteobacteria-12]|jgi:fatty-acyl-CoA synthase|nr:MAG: acyl-CoA synthetase [Deltaproteobacteria bacterium HGW-Deltaproteobacteria-12]
MNMRTTKYTIPIKDIEDMELLEQQPYEELVPARSIYDLFTATATLFPDRPGLTVLPSGNLDDVVHTRSNLELWKEITRVANMMHDLITRKDGAVAIFSPTYDQIPATIWGTQTAGIVSSINYLLSPEVIVDLLRAENAEILVVPGPSVDPNIWEKALAVIAQADMIKKILVIGGPPAKEDRMYDFDETVQNYPNDRLTFSREIERNTIAALFHTGGTTGVPKLTQLTHGNQIHGAWAFAQMWHIDETDVVLNCLPMFHVGGTISLGMSGMGAGAHEVVLSPYGLRNQDIVRNYWRIVERYKATIVGGVPTAIVAISDVPVGDADISSIRMGFTGGALCPVPVGERFEKKINKPLIEQYGMTETGAMISSNPFMGKRILGSAGLRVPFSDLIVARQEEIEKEIVVQCAVGEVGSVLLRGPQVFPGYKDPQHNAGALLTDGWLVTGDLGYMNAENRLFLTGREKDLIIRGGHNIDPAAIEEVANAYPAVSMSAAVGMPDEYAGEVPVIFVVRKPGQDLDVEDLQKYLTENISEPPAKPKKILAIAELPTTTVGKIFKPRLRELAVQEKIRQLFAKYIDNGAIADITTETLKNGTTNATVAVNSGSEVMNKQETEDTIMKAFVDLPINLRIIWK